MSNSASVSLGNSWEKRQETAFDEAGMTQLFLLRRGKTGTALKQPPRGPALLRLHALATPLATGLPNMTKEKNLTHRQLNEKYKCLLTTDSAGAEGKIGGHTRCNLGASWHGPHILAFRRLKHRKLELDGVTPRTQIPRGKRQAAPQQC